MLVHIILIAVLTIFVSSAAVYGFIAGGSPFELRGKKFDQTRIQRIQSLSSSVDSYFSTNKKLPQNLGEIFKDQQATPGYNRDYYKDPETNQEFEYDPKGDYSYEICANFSADPPKKEQNAYYDSYRTNFNQYKKGRHCFDLTISGYKNYFPSPTPVSITAPEENIQDRITNINKDGIPYFVIVGSYKGIKSQYEISISTKDKFGDPLEISIIHDQNREANIIDKQNNPLKLEKFVVGDRIKVEANTVRGQSYDANTIQNLTR